jgi:hypothetical protein
MGAQNPSRARALKALGEPLRIRLFTHRRRAEPEEGCASRGGVKLALCRGSGTGALATTRVPSFGARSGFGTPPE